MSMIFDITNSWESQSWSNIQCTRVWCGHLSLSAYTGDGLQSEEGDILFPAVKYFYFGILMRKRVGAILGFYVVIRHFFLQRPCWTIFLCMPLYTGWGALHQDQYYQVLINIVKCPFSQGHFRSTMKVWWWFAFFHVNQRNKNWLIVHTAAFLGLFILFPLFLLFWNSD